MKAKRVMTVGGLFYGVRVKCPGCGGHTLPTQETPEAALPSNKARWTFSGDYDRPTFTPSILARWYEMSADSERRLDAGEQAPLTGATRPDGTPERRWPGRDMVCHSFVTDGRIQFLSDCTHALAGQTVYLLELEE